MMTCTVRSAVVALLASVILTAGPLPTRFVRANEDSGSNAATSQRIPDYRSAQPHGGAGLDTLFGFKRRGSLPLDDPSDAASPHTKSAPADAREYRPLQPDEPLTSAIQRGTPARRAAALRLAERGRQFLVQKQHQKAVVYLEKALGLEASPYVYYYLARAHERLGRRAEAARFMEVAASMLLTKPGWAGAVTFAQDRGAAVEGAPVARVEAIRSVASLQRSGM